MADFLDNLITALVLGSIFAVLSLGCGIIRAVDTARRIRP